MKTNLVVLDVETGGKEYLQHPITEIYLNIVDPITFKQIDEYHTYVKPYNELKITKEALAVTQVNLKDVLAGIDVKTFVKMLITKFKAAKNGAKYDKPQIIAHNAVFDKNFIRYAFELCGENLDDYIDEIPICTMRLMKLHDASIKNEKSDQTSFNLTTCCERLGIKLKSAHGAKADVLATTELAKKLLSKLRQSPGDNSSIKDEEKQKPENKSRTFFSF